MSYLSIQYAPGRALRSAYPVFLRDKIRALVATPAWRPPLVVDLGAGSGAFLEPWREFADRCVAIDREVRVPGGVVWDFKTPIRDAAPDLVGMADLVFCKSVIEHLHDPAILFDAVRDLLAPAHVFYPGGTLVLMAPDWRTYARVFYDDFTHVRPYDKVSLRDAAEANGFKVDHFELVCQHPVLDSSWFARAAASALVAPFREDTVCDIAEATGATWLRWAKLRTLFAVLRKR